MFLFLHIVFTMIVDTINYEYFLKYNLVELPIWKLLIVMKHFN